MPRKKAPAKSQVYELKITIEGIEPPIWRRVRVPGSRSLGWLHDVIQIAFGWEDCHMHQFIVGKTFYGARGLGEEFGDDMGTLDENAAALEQVVSRKGSRFRYEYDFGDDWFHDIRVEKIEPAGPADRKAVCMGGERSGPPEDCGGPWGYGDFLEAIGDPKHEQHEELLEWIGGSFDPEAFDIKTVNRALARLR